MKCPNCGTELEEEKLLCENCGYEVRIVPEFDIELENTLKESISVMMEDMAEEEIQNVQDNFVQDNFEEDIKESISDYFPDRPVRSHTKKKIMIALTVLLVVSGIAALSVHLVNDYRYNSFEYQYQQAVEHAAHNEYSEAVSYLERALAIHSEDLDVRFLLAKYYEKNGQQQSTVALLTEILNADRTYAKRDEVYDMLLGIFEAQKDYEKISIILRHCDVPRILSKYNKYAALKPVFNKQGGVYDELISISLKGNTTGFVYYTLDNTTPSENSNVYETPILLESGDYTIKAMFVNMYGIASEVETQHFYISLSAPDSPVINPDSGTYTQPFLIEAYHDYSTKVYYTTDGSIPDQNSKRYTDPIEMPYGISNYSFIAIDESGLGSEVVNRTYHLEIQTNFDPDLAMQVLRNNLWASGKLLSVEGNVPNKLGINQYKVRTLYKANDTIYYIVYEEYVDTMGNVHDTNNIYAIDANTADLYKAYKVNEGSYTLKPFAES